MGDDHLDKETSISAELTEAGVKATAKSRIVAAFDRLGGNLFELINVPIESRNTEKRAKMEARVEAIKALTSAGVEKLKSDPEFAERALAAHYGSVFEKQDNKDGVLHAALDDLRRQPPNEEQATNGPEAVSEEFMGKFERYAEEATSEVLREKWGRVLAGEIRAPGTFSGKVLRVVDELDAGTAKTFEDFCASKLGRVVPIALSGELAFPKIADLVSAGLLVEPGLGQHLESNEPEDGGGALWFWQVGQFGFGLRKTMPAPSYSEEGALAKGNSHRPALRVYVLTDVGAAISGILPDRSQASSERLFQRLADAAPRSEALFYVSLGNNWQPIKILPARES